VVSRLLSLNACTPCLLLIPFASCLFLSVSLSGSCPRDETESHFHLPGTFPTHVRQTESLIVYRPSAVRPPKQTNHSPKHRSESAASLDIIVIVFSLHHGAFHPALFLRMTLGEMCEGGKGRLFANSGGCVAGRRHCVGAFRDSLAFDFRFVVVVVIALECGVGLVDWWVWRKLRCWTPPSKKKRCIYFCWIGPLTYRLSISLSQLRFISFDNSSLSSLCRLFPLG
jgi:hypothetical protein